jgi:hypothetical protein
MRGCFSTAQTGPAAIVRYRPARGIFRQAVAHNRNSGSFSFPRNSKQSESKRTTNARSNFSGRFLPRKLATDYGALTQSYCLEHWASLCSDVGLETTRPGGAYRVQIPSHPYSVPARKRTGLVIRAVTTLGAPKRVIVSGDDAYVVVSAKCVYKQEGKAINESVIVIAALHKSDSRWRLTGCTWARL